jgi:bacterioferritin
MSGLTFDETYDVVRLVTDVSDRMIVLQEGAVIARGAPETVTDDPEGARGEADLRSPGDSPTDRTVPTPREYARCYTHLGRLHPTMDDEVIETLRKAYGDELETVMNYLTNAIVLDGVRAEEVKESLQADVQEELTHAEMLGQRLKQLDARPPASGDFEMRQPSLQPPEDSTDVRAVIDGVLDAEEDAIATYRSLVNAAREADDPVTEDLAVTILADEEAHRTEFRGFRTEFTE